MTIPHKLSSSSLTGKASVITLLMMIAGVLFAEPSAMAQQIPLTPQELEQQNRLQNVIAATTRNLEQGQKQVDGIVYTPRWSSPNPVVWVEPNSLSVLFVYCLPGEFADSGQEILGGSDLEVLESYSLAVTNDLMVWFMVVENENENIRLPAAVGVICASDANDVQARVLSPQEQQEINNIIQQFITIQNTQVTNIENVINIINNVTTNGTTTGPVTPPPPTNETGGTTPSGNDTAGTRPPRGEDLGGGILDNATVAGEGGGGETSSREATTPPTNETGGGLLFPSPEVSPLENETLTTGDDEVTIPPTLGGGTATP
jgi:hypothetical protein